MPSLAEVDAATSDSPRSNDLALRLKVRGPGGLGGDYEVLVGADVRIAEFRDALAKAVFGGHEEDASQRGIGCQRLGWLAGATPVAVSGLRHGDEVLLTSQGATDDRAQPPPSPQSVE